jgi:hypothetical protein
MSTLWHTIKETLVDILQKVGQAWWVEIITEHPSCTYYFGPFLSHREAQDAEAGYEEDLRQEGAQHISVQIKRCQPVELTLSEDIQERIEPQRGFSPPIWNLFRRKQILQ